MDYRQVVGSYTARGGFINEIDITSKFNNYKTDPQAQIWLKTMGYNYQKIETLTATQIPPRINKKTALSLGVTKENISETSFFKKADLQVKLEIKINKIYYIENISLKKANIIAGYNQVDKRAVEKYKKIWNIPDSIYETLCYYTGTLKPIKIKNLKDRRRMFLDEIKKEKLDELIKF